MKHRFDQSDIDALYQIIYSRRDIREFNQDPLPEGLMARLFDAAHAAPSVGYMQPWRLLHIQKTELRTKIAELVEHERLKTAEFMPARQQEFLKLKVEGLSSCKEVVVVTLMHGREAHIFGRRTMPEMDLASASCAIQNMWLAARAEGVGIGWVSFLTQSHSLIYSKCRAMQLQSPYFVSAVSMTFRKNHCLIRSAGENAYRWIKLFIKTSGQKTPRQPQSATNHG